MGSCDVPEPVAAGAIRSALHEPLAGEGRVRARVGEVEGASALVIGMPAALGRATLGVALARKGGAPTDSNGVNTGGCN